MAIHLEHRFPPQGTSRYGLAAFGQDRVSYTSRTVFETLPRTSPVYRVKILAQLHNRNSTLGVSRFWRGRNELNWGTGMPSMARAHHPPAHQECAKVRASRPGMTVRASRPGMMVRQLPAGMMVRAAELRLRDFGISKSSDRVYVLEVLSDPLKGHYACSISVQ
ncbi:uncharacterized protein B0I36DRAFT_55441 [Microdochium trichocladiopsis]|uniref:Uncharacterized protein n=1 Tax=Microdochium trichocladiopsis TaxID=1682393 RepID=A0A9P8XQV0_9PEZI|nr:uncharacterized protein B0I36DRAFT_55441 [Microdochium trichocladiopsis]KAH7012310.1 hypothetical protein B0I36DRAFT_55441 [Microdochium trichocladiopsis]